MEWEMSAPKEKPETGLHRRIKETLKLYSEWCDLERNNRGMFKWRMFGLEKKGSSDFVGSVTMHDGFARHVAIEVKMPGEKPTKEQKQYIDNVNARGGYGAVVHSVDELVMAIHDARDGVRL